MSERIELYTDWSFKPKLETPPSFLLHPWHLDAFGTTVDIKDKSEFRDVDRFRSIRENYRRYFVYTSDPEDADYAVLPSDWKHYKWAKKVHQGLQFLELLQQLQKRLVVQYNSDDDLPLDLRIDASASMHDPIIVRTSFNASKRRLNEYAMPGFVGDPLVAYGGGKLDVREKGLQPKLSFCGWSANAPMSDSSLEHFHELVQNGLSALDLSTQAEFIYAFRATVLYNLQEYGKFETDFIARTRYCGGIDRDRDFEGLARVRQEYFQSVINSDYVVCVRGKGNYSYRFYETLACGRIPVFVDTDSPLPFSDEINWRHHCVWIDHRDMKNIGEIVASHYHSLTPERYREMQKNNREIWEEMLTLEKYFYHLLKNLRAE
jgi:hypothetical protein